MYGSLGSEAWLSSPRRLLRALAFSWIGRTLRRTDLLGVLRKLLIMSARNMGIVNLCRSCERGRREGSGPGVDDGPAYPGEPRERLRAEVTSSVELSSKELAERGSQSAWWSGLE